MKSSRTRSGYEIQDFDGKSKKYKNCGREKKDPH
jgi:hypothetical protein